MKPRDKRGEKGGCGKGRIKLNQNSNLSSALKMAGEGGNYECDNPTWQVIY
jgi:hypothetical protein